MFRDTRRKTLRNRVIFAAIGVLVMSFGIWLNYQSETEEPAAENAAKEIAADEKQTDQKEQQPSSEVEKEELEDREGTDTEMAPEAYLIKEVDGVVKVFLRSGDGTEELYLDTTVPFDLLSEEDQQLFSDGVEIDTEEELGKFLENFDS